MSQMQEAFFHRLAALSTGDRAALRREAGTMLSAADGKAMRVFYRCIPAEVPRYEEPYWFACACLCCMFDGKTEGAKPLEQVIAGLDGLSDSTMHRMEVLLDTQWDEDGYLLGKLTRLMKLIRQKGEGQRIDFPALLNDLIWWNSEKQTVQRKWARSLFAADDEE